MSTHERTLALASTAIDFPLAPQDVEALARHLAACPNCSLAVQRLREDAAALAGSERSPAPSHVRQSVVRAAMEGRGPMRRDASLRWSLVAVLLALLTVGGTFVAGVMLDRLREPGPLPTDPNLVVRPTPVPQRTSPTAPDPTGLASWRDLGVVGPAFEGRTVRLMLSAPDGDLVAVGHDQRSTLPAVWTSNDGTTWREAVQPENVFGGRLPTSGTRWDDRIWVVGWDISVTAAQRAIWTSADGTSWSLVDDPSALLGTEAGDLRIVSGPAGLLVWAPDGRVWASADGARWERSDIGISGATDAAVDASRFHVVGRDGRRAFVVSSTDGVHWSQPATRPTTADAQVGIERADSGRLLAWIADRPFEVTRDGWQDRDDAAAVPSVADPRDIVSAADAFGAFVGPTAEGVQRAWVGDGTHAWDQVHSEPASGSRTIVGVVGGEGWYVLARQGQTYRGWRLDR